jgi:3-phosphoshikimate 1-carboxyvinyltransferase
MQVVVSPSSVEGIIQAPASKSAMQRACAAALLKGGTTIIRNPGRSNDDKAALDIIQQLGAAVKEQGDHLLIISNGVQPVNDVIHCGESGLSIRMFTPIAALSHRAITITGEGSLKKRPMEFFNEVLPQLGVAVKSNDGKIPLQVKGPLQPVAITVDGSLSSQYLTGLLFAYAAAGARNVSITVENLASKPYVDLTLSFLKKFGLKLPSHQAYQAFYFDDSPHQIPSDAVEYSVEGDWSGAAFLLVAGAIAGSVTLTGLDVASTQADRAILQALMQSGAIMSVQDAEITVRSTLLNAFHFDASDCPDLFPPLVALASCCRGQTVIEGVSRLAHKESNRALTLQEEFGKMGVTIELQNDLMLIQGGATIQGASVHSHHDHRIAMACAVAALVANGETTIDVAEAVNKSYPQFWEHLQQLQQTKVGMGF